MAPLRSPLHVRTAVWLGAYPRFDEYRGHEQDTDSHTPQEEISKDGHKNCPEEAPLMMAHHPASEEGRHASQEEHHEDKEYDAVLLGVTPRITAYRKPIASDG